MMAKLVLKCKDLKKILKPSIEEKDLKYRESTMKMIAGHVIRNNASEKTKE